MRLDQLIREYKTKLAFLYDLISHIASYFNLHLSQSIYTLNCVVRPLLLEAGARRNISLVREPLS